MTGRGNAPPHRPPPPPPVAGGRGRATGALRGGAPMRPGGPPLTRPGGPPTRPGATLMTRPPMGRGAVPVSEIATKMGVLEVTTKSSSSKEKTTSSDETKLSGSPAHSPTRGATGTSGPPVFYRGKEGRPTPISANYLRLETAEGKGVFEYEVRFEPRVDSREARFKLLNSLREITGTTKSFDGAKLFLPLVLNPPVQTAAAPHPSTGEQVQVTLAFKKERKSGDRDVVQHYNILFNRIMRVLKFTMHNRNFYDAKGAHHIRQYNLQVWPGYITAVDEYEGGLLLQVDVSHRVLRTETVRDVIVSLKSRGIRDIKSESEKALLGTSVLTRYNNKTYKIDDLDFSMSPRSTFTNEKGEEISYMDYYKAQYGITIKDPDQPMILHRMKKTSVSDKEITKLICLVPELCMLTGMSDSMRADFKIMKEVGNFTRVTPQQRLEAMKNFLKRITEDPAAKTVLADWGLQVSENPISLDGRILPAPMMHFGGGRKELVGPRGDWSRAATNNPVLTPVHLSKWAVFYTERATQDVQKFCKTMQQLASRMGITMANPKPVKLENDRTETYLQEMRKVIDPSVQLVMTIFPKQNSGLYAAVKKLCYVEKPVASQVVLLKSINNEKKMSAVAAKVVLQMNCKMGGELWACESPYEGLMVVGIDVYHDKALKGGSIAGVVASINDKLSRYYSTVKIQGQGQEITDVLTVAFMDALLKYWETNHKWPKNVLVFRDGVSDGQMDTVERHEVQQFLRTFKHIAADGKGPAEVADRHQRLGAILPSDYNPGFNFVVVQKRINTRIFSVAARNQFQNPGAGTILDHTVTRRHFKDFFLVPQAVTQGTVTPTHFVVISETGSCPLPADAVQRLTYMLTHMYYNWPGTVRVPAPCQYAHKMVDMAGANLHNVPSPNLNDRLYFL